MIGLGLFIIMIIGCESGWRFDVNGKKIHKEDTVRKKKVADNRNKPIDLDYRNR